MAFFEPPPLPDPPERPDVAAKAWWHAPRNELGASSGLRLVVARTDDVAIALVDAIAYSTGVDLVLVAARRVPRADAAPFEMRFGPFMSGMAHGSELPPELLRFGVQFADGRKATSVGVGPYGIAGEEEPEGPLLLQGSGGGADDRWELHFWLWPLPPPGPLAFVVEWPAEGIDLTRLEVDSAPIIEASRRSEVLWAAAPPGDHGWTGYA